LLSGALSRFLLDPVGIAILALLGAILAERYGRLRLARGLVIGTVLFLTAFCVLPLDDILARPLENRYPRPALPARVDGIVVLSGSVKPYITASRGVMPANASVMRMLAGADLARRYPQAKLVFSGIVYRQGHLRQVEIESVLAFFRSQGIPPQRVIIESRSLDTDTNLSFSRALVKPKPDESWILVTSAMHLPRAMTVAKRLGWTMIPWASDYETPAEWRWRNWKSPADSLVTVDKAMHEWVGRLVYGLTGRT
jgi:uncharacterized SAM-binding protein YcdF (DUF218 family)